MRLRVGLTGGIGAGKSTVADVFRDLGAVVIDADALARDALAPSGEGVARVLALFPEVASAGGAIDRAALAARVFADADARAALNAIVHPIVRAQTARLEGDAPAGAIVVQEVPLLFETGLDRTCDATVLVAAPVEERIARVAARSGLARDEILRRMAAQIDPVEARRRATYTIDNDGTLDRLRERCAEVWRALEGLPPRAA